MSGPTREQVVQWACRSGLIDHLWLDAGHPDERDSAEQFAALAYAAGQEEERMRAAAPSSVADAIDRIESAIKDQLPRAHYSGSCADLPNRIRLSDQGDNVVGD